MLSPILQLLQLTRFTSSGQSPFDIFILNKATQRARRFATQPSMTPFVGIELAPGAAVTTDAEFTQFVKDAMAVAYHPLGTAAIGERSGGGVVDANLRVYGAFISPVVHA
jgi:choline dehydrogenase-like flavoprotein